MKIHSKSVFGRIVSFLLVVVMLMSMIAVGTFSTSAATSFTIEIASGAEITVTDSDGDTYYEIYTADELEAFSTYVTSTTAAKRSCNAILMADIVYNEGVITEATTGARVWNPIGGNASNTSYRGDFNGNNKSISGLYHSSSSSYRGFVGYLYDGTVRNLTIKNSYFSGANSVGGVVGRNGYNATYYSTVENCASINNTLVRISSSYGEYYGGVVGSNYGGEVLNCFASCSIYGTKYVGGVVGRNQTSGTVTNCLSISTNNNGATSYVGGVCGQNVSGTYSPNCYYLDTTFSVGATGYNTSGAVGVTAEELASGKVAYLLQGSQTEHIWGQTIGTDTVPVLFDDKVYYTNLTCAEDSPIGYSNTLDPQHNYGSVVTPPTPYDRGYTTHTCSVCGDTYNDSYVNPTNVSGDVTLLERLDSDGAFLSASPSYVVDEAIYVTAANGVWVGLYPSSVTVPANKTDAIYTYELKGRDLQTFDIRTGTYNASNTKSVPDFLNMGETYNIFLFSDSEYTVAATASFKVTASNEDKRSDGTYLQTNRKVYTYGESMMLNANAADNSYAWVGVYPKGSANTTTPAEYIVYIGSSFSPSYAGQTVDIINSSQVNKGAELLPGDYDVCLFADRTLSTVLAQVSISVKAGFVSTDKDSYGFGERIIAKASLYNSENVDISNTLYITGSGVTFRAAPDKNGASQGSITYTNVNAIGVSGPESNNWAHISYNNKVGYISPYIETATNSDVKIYGYFNQTTNLQSTYSTGSSYLIKQFPAGTAFNYIEYYSTSYYKVQIGGYTGYVNRTGITDKTTYTITYHPHDNSNVATVGDNAWVGLYDKGVVPGAENTPDAWYYLRQFPEKAVVLQDLASGDGSTYAGTTFIDVGEHTLNLYGDGDYTKWMADKTFTVSDKVTGSFKNGAYKMNDLADGFANGTVALELSDDSLGYIGNADAEIYWADADGNPLEGYTALASKKITASAFTFDMYPHTIIPEGAKSLVAYVAFKGTQGEKGHVIPLPANCASYDGLGEGVLSEFQIVSDLHITSDASNTSNTNYQAMLSDIAANSPSSAGIFVNGDIANNGLAAEYAKVTASNPQTNLYVTMGNSDAYSGNITDYVAFANSLGANITANKPYYSKMVNGYKYIFLACDDTTYYGADKDSAKLSQAQLQWLDAELLDNELNNVGKPVFVMMHQPVANSVAGSFDGQWAADKGIVNADELKKILSSYDDVILLSGHSHYDLESEGNHNPGDETLPVTVNTSAVSSLRNDDGTVSGSQGFYVKVYNDKVVFLGRDFVNKKWIPDACYVFYNDDLTVKSEQVIAEYGDMIYSDYYVQSNPNNRELLFKSTDTDVLVVDENGDITASGIGTATICVTAKATDTEVVTIGRFPVKVVEQIDENYYVKGSFDNWTEGVKLTSTDNPDVISATIKLYNGTYDFRINNFETWYGSTAVVNDKTESAIVMNGDDDLTLNASGGTYTFTYTISTNTLEISCVLNDANVGGDEELFNKVNSTKPYVDASKDAYQLGESIYLTADGGTWVGIYKADVTDYASTEASYIYNVSGLEGIAYDIRNAVYTGSDASADPVLTQGSYQAVLFGTNDRSQVLDTVKFDVVDGNCVEYGNNMLSTNKTTYYYGEPILSRGWTNRPDLRPWIGVAKKGVVPKTLSDLVYWYYLPVDDTGILYVPLNTANVSVVNTGVALEPGTYDVWLYRTSNYDYPTCSLEITVVDGKGTVSTSKDTYGIYEDIIVNTNYPNAGENAWVGIFNETTLNGATPTDNSSMVSWYYIDPAKVGSHTVVLQDLSDAANSSNPLSVSENVAGEYSVYLFGDSSYTDIQAKTKFSISDAVTGTFGNGAYKVDDLDDGFANGTVVLEVAPDSLGAIGTTDTILYWGDAQGKPLEGYTGFHKRFVDKSVITFDLNSHTIIPEGAETLVAYMSSYNDTHASEGLVIPLPNGCAAYDGLDENILSEFQIVSDLHITSDATNTSNTNYQAMLGDIAANSPSSAGIFVNGNVANNGLAAEYAKVTASNSKANMYVTMGNSDAYSGNITDYVAFANSLGANITADKPYYSKMVNGYKYIFLAGDDTTHYGADKDSAKLSQAQLEWLEAELLDNEQNNAGKPVFILLNQGVENTVSGTYNSQAGSGLVNADEFKNVVNHYNNVILISGQGHYLINSSDSLYAGGFDMSVAINAGSTSDLKTDYINRTSDTVSGSQGYYVRTYEDKVVFLGRDFVNNLWIPDACFVLYNQDVQADEVVEIIVDEQAFAADFIENPNNRDLKFSISDPTLATVDADGTITALYPGEPVLTVIAAATDTEVVTIDKVTLDVRGEGYPSRYSVKGTHNWDTEGDSLIYTADKDIVTVTIELAPGEYEYVITNNKTGDIFGTSTSLTDKTTETLNLDSQEFINLKASGGYYTFTYSISKNTLDIEFEPLDLTEKGKNEATIYVDFTNSDFEKIPNIYIWEPERDAVNKNIGPFWPGVKLEGPNAEGYYYRTFKFDESYQFVITDGEDLRTADSIVHTESEVYVTFTGGTEYTEERPHRFWIDLDPHNDTSDIDLLYPEMGSDGIYYFYLPAGANTKSMEFHKTEGSTLKISYIEILDGGTMNLSGGVNKVRNYVLGGDFTGKFRVKQSAEVASLYTYTNEQMPTATDYLDNSEVYTSSGSIMMLNKDMTYRLSTSELDAVNSCEFDFDAANYHTGRYSFDLTLNDTAQLIADGSENTNYTLISLNADEARMRNMTAYDLAAEIGIEYYADCEVVDLYNDGRYMGTYLLVTKDDTLETVAIEDAAGDTWNKFESIIYNSSATYEQLSEVIDVESFAKMYLLLELAKDADGTFNVYEKDGKFFADVAWDTEYTFGHQTTASTSVAGKFASDATNALNDPEGWWINSMTTSADSGTLTILAALCQSADFWNVVKAEYNELFLDKALTFSDSTVTSVSALDMKVKEYYTMLKSTTAMDEHKWKSIANDLLASTGVTDTGDTFDSSVVWFNNFYFNRLMWMSSKLASTDYDFATPTLTTDKDVYRTDEVVNLTATCNSSGNLTYNFYDGEGNLVKAITTDTGVATYSFTSEEEIDADYKVVVTSPNTTSVNATATTHVIVEKFELVLNVDAPESVPAGMVMTVTVTSNVDEGVVYFLKDSNGEIIDANNTGKFEVITSADEAGVTVDYTVEGRIRLNDIEFTATEVFSVDIINYSFDVVLSAPESVEKGMNIKLEASAKSPSVVTYTFYNAETDTVIETNNTGACLYKTVGNDKDSYKSFYVVAETYAYGVPYTAKSDVITVNLTEIEEVYNLTVYFKSTSTVGYNPMITTQGAVADLTDSYMERDIFICKNETETASYFWYKAEIAVSKNNPSVFFSISSSRYAMDVQGNLLATEDKTYYFAVDNLNSGIQLIDLTEASKDERNWCESAVHMVYDSKYDSEESLAAVTARVDLRYVGDTDADGKVNIRDATYIQKFLADLVTMNSTSVEVADVDCDSKVTIKDATALQKKLAGISLGSYT